jgi:hypothetical protein
MKVRDRAGSTFWMAAERVDPVFFSDPIMATMKALGVT